MRCKKVYLTGRDYVNWATDDDHRLTRKALAPFCDFVSIEEAEVIHAVCWYSHLQYNPEILRDKYVIAHIPIDVKNFFMELEFCKIVPFVNLFIAPTTRAKRMIRECGLDAKLVPYIVDLSVFYPMDLSDSRIKEIKKKHKIPEGSYLIGSFQRDTEGKDLKTPKYIKGPDIFLTIVKNVYNDHKNIHIILSGPRRFWIREQLDKAGIPYTFIGTEVNGRDDLKENTLPQEVINILYNLIDLYIVSSRMEGGPKAILEANATKCKIISTKVGHAEDILTKESIFDSVDIGSSLVLDDINKGSLQRYIENNYLKAVQYSPANVSAIWKKIYDNLQFEDKPKYKIHFREVPNKRKPRYRLNLFRKKEVAFLHQFHKPPWGGGNQFLLALKKSFKKRKVTVINRINNKAEACLFNSFTFDFAKLENKSTKDIRMIHRVDGPTFLIRGKDKDWDDKLFFLNNKLADFTAFQSYWSLAKTIELGYQPVNPIIIPNAVDPEIFNRTGRKSFSRSSKVKLISTSWSDNIRKGYPTYKWLDEHLDWSCFEYTFVGRVPGNFTNIRLIRPQPLEKLAEIFREHDVYITASQNDPCSNALIEALSCGLPAIYLNSGGHSELVGFGGLGFSSNEEILPLLARLVENYEMFQDLIVVPSIKDVADRYLALLTQPLFIN